jgi:bifunctional aspartokinase / homoserine dehydrogenase 1
MIVMKIGGSSLRNAASLLQAAQIVIDQPFPRIVVLSAVSGVTDHLLKSIDEALHTERKIRGLLDYLETLHRELNVGAITDKNIRRNLADETDYLLSRLEKLLYGVAYTGECTSRSRDLIVSFGERLSARLLAACLQDKQCLAQAFDADKIDLIASGDFGNGNADLEKTSAHLAGHLDGLLDRNGVPVITGFFGRTPDQHTITFGRGGTDYSAAVVAFAMNADELQIWKDVDGFLTADPELVPEAKPLQQLSYDEAAELSYFGAAILHPRTVEPLAKKNIPAVIKNTYSPELPGTIVAEQKLHKEGVVKSVVANRKIGALRLHGASVGQQIGFLKTVVTTLSDAEINIISVITAQTAVILLLAKTDVEKSAGLIEKLEIPCIDHLEPITDIALIAVVGVGLAETKGLAGRVFTAVARAGTNVEMIASGASRVTQYFIIKETDIQPTVKSIHDEFFSHS